MVPVGMDLVTLYRALVMRTWVSIEHGHLADFDCGYLLSDERCSPVDVGDGGISTWCLFAFCFDRGLSREEGQENC